MMLDFQGGYVMFTKDPPAIFGYCFFFKKRRYITPIACFFKHLQTKKKLIAIQRVVLDAGGTASIFLGIRCVAALSHHCSADGPMEGWRSSPGA